MKNVLNVLKKYLVYQEPKNKNEFELLETRYEGTDMDGFEDGMNYDNYEKSKDKSKDKGEVEKEDNGEDNNKASDKTSSKSNGKEDNVGDEKDTDKNNKKNDNEYNKKNRKDDKKNEGDKNSRNNENDSLKKSKENSKNLKTKTPLKIEEWNEAKKDKNADSDKKSKNDSKKNENEKDSSDEKDSKDSSDEKDSSKNKDIVELEEVSEKLEINLKKIQEEFVTHKNSDLIIRQFMIDKKHKAFIVFIDGMVDRDTINNYILRQLMMPNLFENTNTVKDLIEYIEENVLAVHDTKKEKSFKMIIRQILNGLTVLFVEGSDKALIFETRGYEKRSVEKPVTENVIRGSQEGFNENLRTNITLIRRIVKNNRLVTEIVPVGKENNSHCAILYIEGITNPKVVNEVKRRIASIDVDFVSGEGMLEQLIEDRPFMIFPQVLRTERPDRAASFLMNGKVIIVADGTPFIIAVPISFYHLIQSSEDANMKWQFATVLRNIRAIGLLLSIVLPGIYIALTLYHQEMIPTDLLIAIAQSRENVPFPVLIETVLMELSFELIREAGVRVPGIIGTTLGIIGALILGQAAVAAGIVSPILIIVVAVTGLGNFTSPDFALGFSIRILRFALIVLGGLAGFYGISLGIFIIIGSLCNIKSFGVPLLSPVGPKTKGYAGIFIRSPYGNEDRSDYLNTLKRKRTSSRDPRKWVN